MAGGRLIGEAYIVVYPQTDGFQSALRAKVEADAKAVTGNVKVAPDLDAARMAAMKAALDSVLKGGIASIKPTLDPASMAKVKAQVDALARSASTGVQLSTSAAQTHLDALMTEASVLSTRLQNLRADVNDAGALAKVAALQVRADALEKALSGAGNGADLSAFEAKLLGLQAAYEGLMAVQKAEDAEAAHQTTIWGKLGLQGAGSLIHITDLLNAASRAGATGSSGIELFGGAIGKLAVQAATASGTLDKFSSGAGAKLATAASHFVDVATYGHLATEAVIEFTAVWVPATIALGVFAAAATPTVIGIYHQLQNMETVSKATGQEWQSLATQGQSVIAAVKPTVMEAFGIALYAVQQRSSGLAGAMHTLGQDIDQMAAKAAIAFDKGSGTFFQTGVRDANALMISFEHLGSIIGTLMKAVPGYAEVLLGFGNDLLSLGAKAASGIEPVLAELLKLHGALLYGGLAGTAASWVFPKITEAAANAALGVGLAAEKILGSESKVVSAATGLGGALQGLSAGPIVAGVGLVVGAFAALYMYLKLNKGAADNFNASIQNLVKNASLGTLQSTLTAGIQQTTVKYVAAQQQQAAAADVLSAATARQGSNLRGTSQAYADLRQRVVEATASTQAYHGGLVQLTQQQQNVNSNLMAIASAFHLQGSASQQAAQALSIANGAQITSNQLTSKGADNLQTMLVEAHGYAAELSVMTAGTDTLNQALNALNVTQSVQVQDAQKLAQAYSSWIGIVTSGQGAFITFEQGQQTLASVLKQGDASGAKLTVTVGKLREQYPLVGAAMNGLTPAALSVQQAFLQQIQGAVTLYGNLQTMAAVSNNTATSQVALARAGKDLVAQLLPMAAGSQQATTDVYALAQIVGYAGPNSFKSLAQWLGTTKGAAQDLNKQQLILTESSANLTQAARDLQAAIGAQVTAAEAAAIAKTVDLSGKTQALADAFNKAHGEASASVQTYAGQLYNALLQAGASATTAKDDVNAFLTQLGATSDTVKKVDDALANLPKTVDITIQIHEALVNQIAAGGATNAIRNALVFGGEAGGVVPHMAAGGATNAIRNALVFGGEAGGVVPHMAAGGRTVRGSGPSGKDSQLIMAAPGELIIPTSHAPAFRDMARKASIPGFEGGGISYSSYAGQPYAYHGLSPHQSVVTGSVVAGSDPLTRGALDRIASLLETLTKLTAQQSYSYASALNQSAGQGIRRGWFATSG